MVHIPNGNSSIIHIIKFYYNGNLLLLPYSMSVRENWIFQEVSIRLGVTQVSPLLWGKLSPTVQAQFTAFPSDSAAHITELCLGPGTTPQELPTREGHWGTQELQKQRRISSERGEEEEEKPSHGQNGTKVKNFTQLYTTNYGDISDLVLSITDYNM